MTGPYRDKHLTEAVKGSEKSVLNTGEHLKILHRGLLCKHRRSCFESCLWLTLKRFLLLKYMCIEYELSQGVIFFYSCHQHVNIPQLSISEGQWGLIML